MPKGSLQPQASPGPRLSLLGVSKRYGAVAALAGIDLEVQDGEFLTLLGPSGSGKSTLLMIVAGLIDPSDGLVLIDGVDSTGLASHRRQMGFVFQHYALFPHMTVFENIAFPLRVRHQKEAEVAARVSEAVEMVGLNLAAHRYPRQLSGGQQQRVALARALVWRPAFLLMDEPLGALDKRLRVQMQLEIRRLQMSLGITTIYVTHDQDEAMTMSDRIVVMRDGGIVQIGKPLDLYERPRDRFVATFLGDANVLAGRVQPSGGCISVDRKDGSSPLLVRIELPVAPARVSLEVAIRPERIEFLNSDSDSHVVNRTGGIVATVAFAGNSTQYRIDTEGGIEMVVRRPNTHGVGRHQPGERVQIGWRAEDTVVLEASDAPKVMMDPQTN